MIRKYTILVVSINILAGVNLKDEVFCKVRQNNSRQTLSFEIPPWQDQPVELEYHLHKFREQWGTVPQPSARSSLDSNEISRYMDTVIAPYLDTYHQNIQNVYALYTASVLKKIKDILYKAELKKKKIYEVLTALADKLNVTESCNEERRACLTIAVQHVANTYKCAEDARKSIPKFGKYADDMISITNNHMESRRQNITEAYTMGHSNITNSEMYLKDLSKSAVKLGYELDLSLTNARRFNEQYCEKLSSCVARVRTTTKKAVSGLRDLLYQCMYA